MKVLLTSASFRASYGGPAYSVHQLAVHLAMRGLEVAVWAPDGSTVVLARTDTMKHRPDWPVNLVGSLRNAISTFGTPDLFHDSGLWWRHNRMIAGEARRLKRPLVISVRGMLEPAAVRHRAWKKRIGWQAYQKRILNGAAALHVASELEAESVRAYGLKPEIVRIVNGLAVSSECPVRAPAQSRRVVFLGRLHPIKGLPMLLDAWARIRPADWYLEIAGPDESGHRKSLEAQVDALGLKTSVTFTGPVSGAEKEALLLRANLFVLPSLSENFGLAAGEALAAGLPVIASKGTPWAALEMENCGWHVPTSVDGLETGLRIAFSTPPGELAAMGRRGHAYVARTFSWRQVADEMVQLYRRIRT